MNLSRLLTVTALAAAVSALAPSLAAAQSSPIVLRYAGTLPLTHHIAKGGEMFARLMNERSGGKVKVEYYPAGQLYKAHDIVGAAVSGALDMGDNLTVVWSKSAIAELPDVPFLFRDAEHAKRAWARDGLVAKIFAADMEKKGLRNLHFMNFGSLFDFSNNVRQLVEPKDFKGLKIRSYGAMAAEALRRLGASPVVMDPGEMYLGLQRGTIDGLISGVTSIDNRKLWEVGKFATITSATMGIMAVNMNAAKYNSLPEDVKKLLASVGDEVQAWTMDESARQDQKSLEFIKEKGVQVHVLNAKEKEAIQAALKPVEEGWMKRAGEEERKALEWARKL